jgi:hypothetical protein
MSKYTTTKVFSDDSTSVQVHSVSSLFVDETMGWSFYFVCLFKICVASSKPIAAATLLTCLPRRLRRNLKKSSPPSNGKFCRQVPTALLSPHTVSSLPLPLPLPLPFPLTLSLLLSSLSRFLGEKHFRVVRGGRQRRVPQRNPARIRKNSTYILCWQMQNPSFVFPFALFDRRQFTVFAVSQCTET